MESWWVISTLVCKEIWWMTGFLSEKMLSRTRMSWYFVALANQRPHETCAAKHILQSALLPECRALVGAHSLRITLSQHVLEAGWDPSQGSWGQFRGRGSQGAERLWGLQCFLWTFRKLEVVAHTQFTEVHAFFCTFLSTCWNMFPSHCGSLPE